MVRQQLVHAVSEQSSEPCSKQVVICVQVGEAAAADVILPPAACSISEASQPHGTVCSSHSATSVNQQQKQAKLHLCPSHHLLLAAEVTIV